MRAGTMAAATADEGGPRVGGATPLEALDAANAVARMEDLRGAAEAAGHARLVAWIDTDAPDARRLAAVLDLSPHIGDGLIRHPGWLDALFDVGVDERIAALIAGLRDEPGEGVGETDLMALLRRTKAEVSALIGLRDLFGACEPARTTADLSALAEAAIGAALRFGLLDMHRRGKIALPRPDAPETGCGLFVLGMGKLGGGELNYSSDIDLIVFFEPDEAVHGERLEAVDALSRLVRRMVRMIGERTAEGYVFRTDLRLRPDPSATPLAISTSAALGYYEGSGRNWERAAMIKARPVAGDRAAGEAFLAELAPFVWRRYLDFASIRDIQAMKTQIDVDRGFGAIAVAGHNVKLGRGGIREIEFFAQAQQLIAGGRAPQLRVRRTDEALEALASGGWIARETAREMTDAYWFLRRVEHAVQMVADEQTHDLPDDSAGVARIGHMLGFADRAAFETALTDTLTRVAGHYAGLFEDDETDEAAPATGDAAENGVEDEALARLLSDEDDPQGRAALEGLGFRRPGDVAHIVAVWSAGRYRATRSEAARSELARVLPRLLRALARAKDPDAALAAFDAFLGGLPAGIQFFALLSANPRVLDLLALIITSAPGLADIIAARPHVFDGLLDPAFVGEVPDRSLLERRLDGFLGASRDYEDTLARLRIFASEQRFLIGARLLSGVIDADEAGPAFSALAETILQATLDAVIAEFSRRHGHVPDARIALLGMGRLGSREMTAGSDVDLILIHDQPESSEESDGEKPLSAGVYFARLTQRLIAALTSRMGEGVLYEVDFRLRPSGNAGPLATRLAAFSRYQAEDAWTWEHMALSRSRAIAGDPELMAAITKARDAVLAAPGDAAAITADVAAMRARLSRDKPAKGPLDIKMADGGLIDLEFLAQWAILTGRVDRGLAGQPTPLVLDALGSAEDADATTVDLGRAMRRFSAVVQILRLGPADADREAALPLGLVERLRTALDLGKDTSIEAALAQERAAVRGAFEALTGETVPAA